MKKTFFAITVAAGAFVFNAGAWDYEGHHAINELALASLPKDFGGFELTPALKGRIEYLAGEPDRWRNIADLPLKNVNGPDHYIDMEDLKLYGREVNGRALPRLMRVKLRWYATPHVPRLRAPCWIWASARRTPA